MKKYKFPDRYEKKSECFTLEADGINIDVYSCDVSAYPFNRVWEGKQRDKSQAEKASFAMLGSDGEVTLKIKPAKVSSEVCVRPDSKKIQATLENDTATLVLPGPGQYSVEFGSFHNSITIFVNPEKEFDVDKENRDVLYFPAGVHIFDKRIELEDNQTVFIDEGAVVYGSLNATDKKNIKILGYGILDNSRMKRANEINGCAILDKNAPENTGNPIFLNRCENVAIEGITIVDSSGWNIYLDGCKDIVVDNIKLIGQWRYNADGCDFCNCTNGVLKNSFLRNFDDCVTVKGFKLNNNLPVENIFVDNCVLWCDWGRALEVGAETSAPYMENITFKNCDIIHGDAAMLDIQQGDRADIKNIHFEDIRIEYTGEEKRPRIQESDSHTYIDEGEKYYPIPIVIQSGVTMWSIDTKAGSMSDIYFKNISISTKNGQIPQGSRIMPYEKQSRIENIYFENITVNGKKVTLEDLGMMIGDRVKNVEER